MKKTSKTHPLRIDAVNVPGTTGVIGMTLCPGKVQTNGLSGEWKRDLNLDLQVIQEWGASTLVSLMQPHELLSFQVSELPARIPPGMTHVLLPILDGGVPDASWEQAWSRIGPQLRTALQGGEKIVIHCLGGLGRTGLVTARLLVEFGMEPAQAITLVRKARPGAIETSAQEHYVRTQQAVAVSPARPYHRIEPERASRYRGCLLGGAVGDALGAPVEFMDLPVIHATFGPAGIRAFSPAYGRLGAITDDTQMTLFTAEGALRAHVRGLMRDLSTVPGVVSHAYQRWLITQGVKGQSKEVGMDGWLVGHAELFSTRAPGNTCLSALKARKRIGDGAPAQNDSKGCGGVMRVAPIGLYAAACGQPSELAFTWGCAVSALTHGHPTGQFPGGVMAMLVCDLVQGRGLREALAAAKVVLRRHSRHEETLAALEAAESLAEGSLSSEEAIPRLGQGWVAEEALGIALFCSLRARNLEEGIVMAVNITGDSDSTGAITGNLLGAMLGVHEIPNSWLDHLELKAILVELADDLATSNAWALSALGHDTPEKAMEQKYWCGRYPSW